MPILENSQPDIGFKSALRIIKDGQIDWAHGNPRSHAACVGITTDQRYEEWYQAILADIEKLKKELGLESESELFYFVNRMTKPLLNNSGQWVLPTISDIYELLLNKPYANNPTNAQEKLKQVAHESQKLIKKTGEFPDIGSINVSYQFAYGYQEGSVDFILYARTPAEVKEAANIKQLRTLLGFSHLGQYIPDKLPIIAVRLVPENETTITLNCVQRIIEKTGIVTSSLANTVTAYPKQTEVSTLIPPSKNIPLLEGIRRIFLHVPEELLVASNLEHAQNFDKVQSPQAVHLLKLLRVIPGDYVIKLVENELNHFSIEELVLLLCIQILQKMGFKRIQASQDPNSQQLFSTYFDQDPNRDNPGYQLLHAGQDLGISENGIKRMYEKGSAAANYLRLNQELMNKK